MVIATGPSNFHRSHLSFKLQDVLSIIYSAHSLPLEDLSSVAFGARVVECLGTRYVLRAVLMAYPEQACSLQGSHGVNCDILAANDLGIGSGWQQSKQNRALLAVVGE